MIVENSSTGKKTHYRILINEESAINKVHFYVKDIYFNQWKMKSISEKHFDNLNIFIARSNDINDVYKNI